MADFISRRGLLFCSLSLTVAATPVPAAEIAPSPASAQTSSLPGTLTSSNDLVKRLQRKPIAVKPARELFGSASWQPAVKPAAAPTPGAPPVPYFFMGRMAQQGRAEIIFLTKGDQVYTVTAAGEVLDGVYSVDAIATDHIALTYLPLKAKQILSFAASAAPSQASVAPPQPAETTVPIATRDVILMAPASPNPPASAQAHDSSPSAPAAAGIPAAKPQGLGAAVPTGSMPMLAAPSGKLPTSAAVSNITILPPRTGGMMVLPPPSGSFPMLPPPSGTLK